MENSNNILGLRDRIVGIFGSPHLPPAIDVQILYKPMQSFKENQFILSF